MTSALTPCWLKEYAEEVTRAMVMAEDEAWVGPERSVKSRFLELLAQHPELTRPQAYMQAVMEITEPVIVKATIGNLDGWRYCVMKVKDDGNATGNTGGQ